MRTEKGNALLYVLIGVALFALLSYSLSRNADTGNINLTKEKTELLANQIITHSQQVQQVVFQMLITGSTIDDIDFVRPGETGYDTAPHQHKVFHPGGGGMKVFNDSNPNLFSGGSRGWKAQTATNVGWTPSTANDIIYSFIDVSPAICAKINAILLGDDTVPSEAVDLNAHFDEEAGGPSDFDASDCADCDGRYYMCIENSGNNRNVFYNVIAFE